MASLLQPWRNAKVVKLADETPVTRRFWLEVPELDRFDFKPGQFVTLDLPIHEKSNKRWRSYSIASWPDGSNQFELIIVRMEDGAGTRYLFEEVEVGAALPIRGPQGVFGLVEPIETDIYLVCTGTGIAPFRSMIHYIQRNGVPHKNIDLVFGCRTRHDLLYYEELIQLERELPGFHYHPVLSREKWEGHQGYVHEVYLNLIRSRAGQSPAHPKVYLCGWKGMIDEARQRLADAGLAKKDILFELYG